MTDHQPTTPACSVSWKHSLLLALLAVYGPFLVLACYALVFESSSYVKRMFWILLPCAPGILPIEFVRQGLNLPRPSDTLLFLCSFLATDWMVAGLFLLVGKVGWMRYPILVVVFSLFAMAGMGLLGLLRS